MKKVLKKGSALINKEVPFPVETGSVSHEEAPILTIAEADVLRLLTVEYCTVAQAAIRRKCSTRAILKIKKKLVEKGVLRLVPTEVPIKGGPSEPIGTYSSGGNSRQIRLHAEHFSVKIISLDDRYRERLRGGVLQLVVDGQSVRCYRNSLDVYSNMSFFGSSVDLADAKSMRYWSRFFSRLENDLKVILLKPRSQNIVRVRAEFAEVGNELARSALKEHDRIRVVGDDGKVWLVVDNSFHFEELETVHGQRSKTDMQSVVQPFFNDLRAGGENVLLPQQVSESLLRLSQSLQVLSDSLSGVIKSQQVSAQSLEVLISLERSRLGPVKDPEDGSSLSAEGVFYVG